MGDKLVELGAVFLALTVIAFAVVTVRQYTCLHPITYRLIVLSTRTATFFPLCAFLIWMSLMSPSSYVMMIGVISVIEGYALYCFLCLIVSNLGGPLATIDLMRNSDRELFCGICCPSDSAMFYDKATWAMFHVLVTRTIIHIFSAISFYAGTPTGLLAYGILNLISAAIIIHGVLCLVILYESVFSYCTNLFGVMKLVLLKICVGVIVIQGLIATFLYSSGATPYQDDDNRSAEDKTQRAYCLLVLCEFALLSVFYYYAFGAHVITPASAPRAVHNVSTDVKTIHSMSGDDCL